MGQRASYDPPDYVSKGPLDHPDYVNEVSEFFLDGMRVRMGISRHKYGEVRDAYPEKFDALTSALIRVREYCTDDRWEKLVNTIDGVSALPRKSQKGNAESLIDASNFLMIEFMHPSQDCAHFKGTDSDESPGRLERVSGEAVQYANRDSWAPRADDVIDPRD